MKELIKKIFAYLMTPITILYFLFFARSNNRLIQEIMFREAKRVARINKKLYSKTKAKMKDATEQEIILNMAFDKNKLSKLSEESRKRIETCCKTINGYCYMMVLDVGRLKGFMIFRQLQFTKYMDWALEMKGFPKQTLKQKKEILEAMGLAFEGWEKWTK